MHDTAPTSATPAILHGFGAIAGSYDLLICDVWGVIHNGVQSFAPACAALARFRETGGTVVLVSNAPRPAGAVVPQLDELGVPRGAWDDLVTSGDVTRGEIANRPGQTIYHLGPERDLPVFDGLDVRFAGVERADYVVCTGLFDDETETADDYQASLAALAARGADFICGNPDLVVERGERMIPCAGALGVAYEALGGRVTYAGKPHRPIYDLALDRAAALRGQSVPQERILAIGDAIRTDIAGAQLMGFASLMVARGIHSRDLAPTGGQLDRGAISHWLRDQTHAPDAIIDQLVWD